MTVKHFVAVAEVIRRERAAAIEHDEECKGSGMWTSRKIAEGVADVFAADNPRFDRARFMAACGLGPVSPYDQGLVG